MKRQRQTDATVWTAILALAILPALARAQGVALAVGNTIPVENVLFASEMIGAVRGIDPETGHYFDDTKRYIEASTILSDEDRYKIYEGNARRVYPRMDRALKARGL